MISVVIGEEFVDYKLALLVSQLGRTLLVESKERLGGRAQVSEKKGFKLDFGPHAIRYGPKSAIAETIHDIHNTIEFVDFGLIYAYLSNGERQIFPSGIKEILKSKMIPKFQAIKLALGLVTSAKSNFKDLLSISLKEYCDKKHLIPELNRFLLMSSSSMQVNPFPDRSSVGEIFSNFVQVMKRKSIFYPKGGWEKIFNQLKQAIEKNGEIRISSPVSHILIENNTAVGIEVNNERIEGKYIISTIPVQQLFNIIEEGLFSLDFVKTCKNFRPTRGISIDFCLSQKISEETLMFIENPLSFGLFPTNLDSTLAPTGKLIMTFFAPLDKEMIQDKQKRENFYKEFKAKIFSIYPDIPKYLELERPLFLDMVDGVEIAVDQNRENRPKPTDCPIHNLFLTGDSIGGEGGGGDIGHTSVRECYHRIQKEMGKK